MNGLDANILLRYFAQDDPVHSAKATRLIEHRLSETRPGYVSLVTMAELVWTLSTSYAMSRPEIALVIEKMIASRRFVLQNEREVFIAMMAMEEGHGFADALIAALGSWAGCSSTFTFDRKASRLKGFELIA
jgi:predicted nucleic-acid-binding protein